NLIPLSSHARFFATWLSACKNRPVSCKSFCPNGLRGVFRGLADNATSAFRHVDMREVPQIPQPLSTTRRCARYDACMNPTQRFSSRVADYVRYRPSYPIGLLDKLMEAGALRPGTIVADIGSGTGLLTRLFLERGYTVHGIEPNDGMRRAGEEQLQKFSTFK